MVNNILLIRPDMIGDTVLITPAVALLRQKFPGARISLLTRSYASALYQGHPDIDAVLLDQIYGKSVFSREFSGFVRQIKDRKFDLCLAFYNEFPYALLCRLAGIPYRVGDRSKVLFGWMYNVRVYQKWSDLTKHEVDHNIELLAPLGITTKDPPPLKVAVSAAGERALAEFLTQNRIAATDILVGIHPGTGHGNKAWLAERYAAVINYLHSDGKSIVVLLGGEKELAIGRRIEALCAKKPFNLIGRNDLPALASIIARLNLYIGVDSGPMHIAAAFGVPTVALFPAKQVKPVQWGPWRTQHIVIRKPFPCERKCLPAECELDACLRQIEASEVIEAVKKLRAGEGKWSGTTRLEWLRQSTSILTNEESIRAALKAQRFNVIFSPKNLSFSQYLDLIVKEDINIIHWVGRTTSPSLYLAKLFSALFVPIPPLFIRNSTPEELDDLAAFYTDNFKKRRYL